MRCSIPLPVVAAVRRELEKRGMFERQGGKIALTSRGRDFVELQLQVRARHSSICPACQGHGIVIGSEMEPVIDKLRGHFAGRPGADTTLDQAFCFPETSVRRALFMHEAGALEGKNVLFLGDDDSVSLAVGLVGQVLSGSAFARRLTVIDADERILDYLSAASRAEGLNIDCILHDLREPLPQGLRGQFDTFASDPPYTENGVGLFVSRGIEGLKAGVGRQGFLSYGSKSPDEALRLAEMLTDMGLSTAQIIPRFNRYEGASIIGGLSQLLHLLSTSATKPMVGEQFHTEPIYTGEAAPTARLYLCLQCRAKVLVGHGQTADTIEKLKVSGCPRCGNTTFSYQRRVRPATTPGETSAALPDRNNP